MFDLRHFALLAVVLLSACGTPTNGNPDAASTASCEAIVAACHPVDPGSGPIHECHENAEALWVPADCVSNQSRCTSLCAAAADAGREGGAEAGADASADAGPVG